MTRCEHIGWASGAAAARLRVSTMAFSLLGKHHAATILHLVVRTLADLMRPSCCRRVPTAFCFRTVHPDLGGLCRHWADMLECHKPSRCGGSSIGWLAWGARHRRRPPYPSLSSLFLSFLGQCTIITRPACSSQPYDVCPHRKQGIQGSPPPSHCALHACLRRRAHGISIYPCLLMTSCPCTAIFPAWKITFNPCIVRH